MPAVLANADQGKESDQEGMRRRGDSREEKSEETRKAPAGQREGPSRLGRKDKGEGTTGRAETTSMRGAG